MQKIALSISITLLALAIIFAGILVTFPSPKPQKEDVPVISEDFEKTNETEKSPNSSSVWILGDNTKIESTPTPKQPTQQTYQLPTPLPTVTTTPEPVAQPMQEQKLPWAGGFANKEAYCKDVANKSLAEAKLNPPYVDQSQTPPELRVTINWDVWWSGLYQDCMDFVKNY